MRKLKKYNSPSLEFLKILPDENISASGTSDPNFNDVDVNYDGNDTDYGW